MKYQPYEKYKDSGVAWIGMIPEDWGVKKIQYVCKLRSGSSITAEEIEKEGRFPVFGGNGIRGYTEEYTHRGTYVLVGRQGALCGNVTIAEGDFWASEHALVAHPLIKYNAKWLAGVFTIMNLNQYSVSAAQPGLSVDNLGRLQLPFPPAEEQKAITAFLDEKTAEIDALISKKEGLLLKLAEKRTAMITHAVTKGLNPSTPMKDSGIDWLGQIPANWDMKRLKFSALSVNEKTEQDLVDAPYMGLEHVESWTGKRIIDDESKSEGIVSLFRKNDVLFGKLRPYLAKIYLADEAGCSSTEFLNLRARKILEPSYLKYYLLNKDFIDLVDGSTYGAKMPRASWDFIGNQFILLPPNAEQRFIADFLDNKTAEMDKTAHTIKNAIDSLKEYRSALITNAVTGKIKVT